MTCQVLKSPVKEQHYTTHYKSGHFVNYHILASFCEFLLHKGSSRPLTSSRAADRYQKQHHKTAEWQLLTYSASCKIISNSGKSTQLNSPQAFFLIQKHTMGGLILVSITLLGCCSPTSILSRIHSQKYTKLSRS